MHGRIMDMRNRDGGGRRDGEGGGQRMWREGSEKKVEYERYKYVKTVKEGRGGK